MEEFMEKWRKKREIQNKIDELGDLITEVRNVKEEMARIKRQINLEIDNWEMKYSEYLKLELAPEIRIINSFEGLAAEQLALDMPPMVTEINDAAGKVIEIVSGIDDQIGKIEEYIEELNRAINDLKSQMEAL